KAGNSGQKAVGSPLPALLLGFPMTITRVMGLDPGSETTGYGIIDTDGRKHVVVEFGAIRSTSRMAFPDRLLNISSKIETIIERTRPECFAIEETFYAVNI